MSNSKGFACQAADDLRRAQMRNALSLLLDRKLPPDDAISVGAWEAVRAYQAVAGNSTVLPSVTVVPSGCDRVHLALHTVAAAVNVAQNWNTQPGSGEVVVLPCPGLSTIVRAEQVAALLAGGGLLVTSGRALERDALRDWLPSSGRRSPGRARVRLICPTEAQPILPAVFIDGGAARLDPALQRLPGVRTLAVDALTEEPLAVLVPAERGHILHSVPHWFQPNVGWFTELELGRVAANVWAAQHWPDATQHFLGDMLAADAMCAILCQGIAETQVQQVASGEARNLRQEGE